MNYLYLIPAFVVGYLLGNINFSRIFSMMFAKKDITQIGSKNPGTMNMLRTRGFGEAMLTLVCEAIKAGGPALAGFFLFKQYFSGLENLAFFIIGFGAVVGHCFPVIYKFKGGKGVACTFGMFLFHPDLWWMSLVLFAIGFILIFFVEYPFLLTMGYVLLISIYSTSFFAINLTYWYLPIIIIIWINFFLLLFLHRGNIKRLVNGNENKVNFREKIFKKKNKTQNEEIDINNQTTEKEQIIQEETDNKQ